MADSLAAALAELQANPPRIRKRARAQYGAYADLPTVHKVLIPRLAELGLLWQTWPTVDADLDGAFVLAWKLVHLESGQALYGWYPIHATDPQKAGSEITYARRYALVTVTGVTPEGDDDDGQAASTPKRTKTQVTGPEHEQLRHGTVEATPDDIVTERLRGPVPADLWSTDRPEEKPGTILPDQRTKIMRLFGAIKPPIGREVRMQTINQYLERWDDPVESVNDLSATEAGLVIASLQANR